MLPKIQTRKRAEMWAECRLRHEPSFACCVASLTMLVLCTHHLVLKFCFSDENTKTKTKNCVLYMLILYREDIGRYSNSICQLLLQRRQSPNLNRAVSKWNAVAI